MTAKTITVGDSASYDYNRHDYASDFACIQAALDEWNNHDFSADSNTLSYLVIDKKGSGTNGEWNLGSSPGGFFDPPTGCTNMSSTAHLVIRGTNGFSFGDNALRYNPAYGTAIKGDPYYTALLFGAARDWPDYTEFRDLQLRCVSETGQTVNIYNETANHNANIRFTRCILLNDYDNNTTLQHSAASRQPWYIDRCLVYNGRVTLTTAQPRVVGSTFYSKGVNDYPMVGGQYSTTIPEISGNLFFERGSANVASGSNTYTTGHKEKNGSNDATDSSWANSVYNLKADGSNDANDCFRSVSAGSEDFRLKATATNALTAGTTVATFSSTDICGTTIGASPALGAWQVAVTTTEKFRIPTTAANGIQRKLWIFSDITLATALVANQVVTASGGYFTFTSPAGTVGVFYPALLIGWGADEIEAAYGGPCWAECYEE